MNSELHAVSKIQLAVRARQPIARRSQRFFQPSVFFCSRNILSSPCHGMLAQVSAHIANGSCILLGRVSIKDNELLIILCPNILLCLVIPHRILIDNLCTTLPCMSCIPACFYLRAFLALWPALINKAILTLLYSSKKGRKEDSQK